MTAMVSSPINPDAENAPAERQALPPEFGVSIILLLVLVYFSLACPSFRTIENFRLLSKQSAQLALLATGMTLVIATGGIDISVGSVLAFCSMTLGWLCVTIGWNVWLACAAAVALGSIIGLANGLLITGGRLPSIVVTLATMAAARAGAAFFNGGQSISGLPDALNKTFDLTNAAGLPLLLWAGVASLVIGAVVLKRTVFGRKVLAMGGNREAARLSGNRVLRTETAVYLISGALAGAAAVINTAHKATATPDAGQFLELTAITAVVLGGTVITGGKATMLGTALGVVTITALTSGVRLMGQEDRLAWFLVGAALLLAVEVQKGRTARKD
jgi:ribose/xylose/arabinose/galactoside ABC-type transport system permease subunit